MTTSKKRTATKSLLFLAMISIAACVYATPLVGTVTHLSGPLLAKKADGSARILAQASRVAEGDTLVTEKNSYAQIRFGDDSTITLKPHTVLTIEAFSYDAAKPADDKAKFFLTKGSVRATTGLLGRRSKDRIVLETPVASVGMQAASLIVQYAEQSDASLASRQAYLRASTAALASSLPTRSDAPSAVAVTPLQLAQFLPPLTKPGGLAPAPSAPRLAPGLYVHVIDGLINVSNRGGSMNFSAGQFGYTSTSMQPPIVVPNNPALRFTPPPTFAISSLNANATSGAGMPDAIDCEVR